MDNKIDMVDYAVRVLGIDNPEYLQLVADQTRAERANDAAWRALSSEEQAEWNKKMDAKMAKSAQPWLYL